MPECVHAALGGIELCLLADRAVLEPTTSTLFIADLHLGKTASFRAAGVPAPEASTARDLQRMASLVRTTRAERLIVLGDLVHSLHWNTPATRDAVAAWRTEHTQLDLAMVVGNHDRKSGVLPEDWRIRFLTDRTEIAGLSLVHDPEHCAAEHPSLAGHLHPGIRLQTGRGRPSMRGPCFWRCGLTLILPAFGSFTGCLMIKPAPKDGVWLVGPDALMDVSGIATRGWQPPLQTKQAASRATTPSAWQSSGEDQSPGGDASQRS